MKQIKMLSWCSGSTSSSFPRKHTYSNSSTQAPSLKAFQPALCIIPTPSTEESTTHKAVESTIHPQPNEIHNQNHQIQCNSSLLTTAHDNLPAYNTKSPKSEENPTYTSIPGYNLKTPTQISIHRTSSTWNPTNPSTLCLCPKQSRDPRILHQHIFQEFETKNHEFPRTNCRCRRWIASSARWEAQSRRRRRAWRNEEEKGKKWGRETTTRLSVRVPKIQIVWAHGWALRVSETTKGHIGGNWPNIFQPSIHRSTLQKFVWHTSNR